MNTQLKPPKHETPTPAHPSRTRRIAAGFAALTLLLPVAVLIGWLLLA